VLGSLGNNDHVTSLDFLLLTTDNSLADTRGEDQVLVDTVDFLSDISTNRDGHDDQLTALACPEDISEFGVLRRNGVDSLEVVHLLGRGRHFVCWRRSDDGGSDRSSGSVEKR
jgi:hypothetical protein